MKTVMLDYANKDFTVSEEGYTHIRTLIIQYQLCGTCRIPIDQEAHLLVGKNLCLSCVLSKHPHLTFQGLHHIDTDGDHIYAFTDAEGTVYTSEENRDSKPEK